MAAGLGGLAVARGQQDQLQGLGVGNGGVRGVGVGRHAVNDAGLRQIHHRGVVPVAASHVGKALGVGGPHRDLSGAGQGAVSGVDGEGDIHRAALTGPGGVLDVVHVLQVVAQIELVIGGDGAAGAAVGQGAGGGLGEGDIGVPAGGGAQQVLKVAGPEAHTGEPRGVAHRQVPPAEVHLPDVQQLPGGAVGHVPEAVGETVAGHVGQIVDHVAPTAAVIEEVVVQVPLPQGAVPAGAGVVHIEGAVFRQLHELDVEAGAPAAGGLLVHIQEVVPVHLDGAAGGHLVAHALHAAGADQNAQVPGLGGLGAPVVLAVGLKGDGDIAAVILVGDKGQIIDLRPVPAAVIIVEGVPGPHPGAGAGGGGIVGVEDALAGSGQGGEADQGQLPAGVVVQPEVLEVVPRQGHGLPVGGGVQHIHISQGLLHGDGQHTGVVVVPLVVGGEGHGVGAGGVLRVVHLEAQLRQAGLIPVGVEVVALIPLGGDRPHVVGGHGVKDDVLRPLLAPLVDRVVDLVHNAHRGAAVGLVKVQVFLVGGQGGVGGGQILDHHGDGAGARLGAAAEAAPGHGHDEAGVGVPALVLHHVQGQVVGGAGGHRLAVLIPVVGDGVLVGDVRAAQGQPRAFQLQLGVGVPQLHVDRLVPGQGQLHLAVVHRQAFNAPAGAVEFMGLLGPAVAVIGADGRVSLAVAVVGVFGVVVVFVYGNILIDHLAALGALAPAQALLVAVGLQNDLPPLDSMCFAVLGACLRREGGGRQGQDHRQGQQQGQAPPARQLLFHNRFLLRIVSRGGSAPAPQLTAPV